MSLENVRKDIDALDAELLALLARRMQLVEQVIAIKRTTGQAPLQSDRYQQLLAKLVKEGAAQGLSEAYVTAIWDTIHHESVRLQSEHL